MMPSSYVVSAALPIDGTNSVILSLLKSELWLKTSLIPGPHSDRYYRQMLDGEKSLPLSLFVSMLGLIYRLGERKGSGIGRERIRRVLQAFARPFGLEVVPSSDEPVKDLRSEVIEAAGACGRAFDRVQKAIADGQVSDTERAEIEAAAAEARQQLDEMVKAAR